MKTIPTEEFTETVEVVEEVDEEQAESGSTMVSVSLQSSQAVRQDSRLLASSLRGSSSSAGVESGRADSEAAHSVCKEAPSVLADC